MLKKQFRKHGYTFTLIRIGIKHLLYRQEDGVSTAYEIHEIRFRSKHTICGKVVKPCIWLPADEDFGRYAWSFADYNRAMARFKQLERFVDYTHRRISHSEVHIFGISFHSDILVDKVLEGGSG